MELCAYFKSIIEQDRSAVVICNLEHTILYMNPAAILRYSKSGGAQLIGENLLNCHNLKSREIISQTISWFKKSKDNNIIYTFHSEKENKDVYMVALRNDNGKLIGYYEKHEYRSCETMPLYDFK